MEFLRHPWLRSKWTLVGVIAAFAYLLIVLSQVVWQNYQVNQQVAALRDQVQTLKDTNKELGARILYYQTPEFAEKEARSKLGLQKPGEEVVIVPGEKASETPATKPVQPTPNWRAWWSFFFDGSA